jgi:hypothetical protein
MKSYILKITTLGSKRINLEHSFPYKLGRSRRAPQHFNTVQAKPNVRYFLRLRSNFIYRYIGVRGPSYVWFLTKRRPEGPTANSIPVRILKATPRFNDRWKPETQRDRDHGLVQGWPCPTPYYDFEIFGLTWDLFGTAYFCRAFLKSWLSWKVVAKISYQ